MFQGCLEVGGIQGTGTGIEDLRIGVPKGRILTGDGVAREEGEGESSLERERRCRKFSRANGDSKDRIVSDQYVRQALCPEAGCGTGRMRKSDIM